MIVLASWWTRWCWRDAACGQLLRNMGVQELVAGFRAGGYEALGPRSKAPRRVVDSAARSLAKVSISQSSPMSTARGDDLPENRREATASNTPPITPPEIRLHSSPRPITYERLVS